jgi:preprotein translocase subunit SecY
MQEKYNTLHHLLNNIVAYSSNISSDYLNNFIPSYCIIFIIAFITLLGFVLFADNADRRITVASYMDTQADLERRANDNTIPLNLHYIYVMSPT